MTAITDPFMHRILGIFGIDVAVARKRLATCPYCGNHHLPGEFRYAYAASPTALKRFIHLKCFPDIPPDMRTYSLEYLYSLDVSICPDNFKQAIIDAIDVLKGLESTR